MHFPQLHNHTMYSFLDGLYKPKDWIEFCVKNGIKGMAITDHGNVHGILEFYREAKKYDKDIFVPILGSEFYFVEDLDDKDNRYHLIVLAKNFEGYQNLLRLSSISYQRDHFYKKPRICFDDLVKHSNGLIVTTACIASVFNKYILKSIEEKNEEKADHYIKKVEDLLFEFVSLFGDDFYIEFQFLNLDKKWNREKREFENIENIQQKVNEILYKLAKDMGIKCIVTNDNHYLCKGDKALQDVMIANSYAGKDGWKFAHEHYYVKTVEQIKCMRNKFHPRFTDQDIDQMVDNCIQIVDKCKDLEIPIGQFNLPIFHYNSHELGNKNDNAKSLILKIVNNNRHLTPTGKEKQYAERLKMEIEIVEKYNLLDYFLIIEDIIRYCYNNNIPVGPGRGSVSGSILAYYLGITNIDPIENSCFWERFISEERLMSGHPPDIDIDFSDEDRDKVKEYIINKYGEKYVANVCTFSTMKIKSAIRDITRIEIPTIVFNLPVKLTDEEIQYDLQNPNNTIKAKKQIQEEINLICEKFFLTPPDMSEEDYFWQVVEENEDLQKWFEENKSIKDKVLKVLGNTRQVGIHASAVAICRDEIDKRIPIFTHGKGKNSNRIWATQYNGNDSESAGAIKIDILGLKTLSVIKNTVELINKRYNKNYHWSSLPSNDKIAFMMMQKGWTETSFQYGTSGFYRLLKDIGDAMLTVGQLVNNNEFGRLMVSLNRPGPLDMGMDKQLIKNIKEPNKIKYLHPLLKSILRNTHGIMIYQEDVMEVCKIIGGFTLEEAEDARRAMGKKKKALIDKLQSYKKKFIQYATEVLEPKMLKKDANTLWSRIYSFNRYGFNRSHACGYDMLGMQTLYLITHYPLEWFTELLNRSSSDKINEIYNYITDPRFNKRYQFIKRTFNIESIPDSIEFILPDINKSNRGFVIDKNAVIMPLSVIKNVGTMSVGSIIKSQPYDSLHDFIDRGGCNIRVIAHLILAGAFSNVEKNKTIKQLLEELYKIYGVDLPSEYGNLDRFSEIEIRNNILEFESINYIEMFKDLFHPYTQQLDIEKYNVGMDIVIGGKVTNKRKIKTKKGQAMGFVTLSNDNKSVDVTLFPDQFNLFYSDLKVGRIAEIHGKVNYYKIKNIILESAKILN